MRMQIVACMVVVFATTLLVACSDVNEMHEPGVYKGRTDPLLAKSGAEQDKVLAERFRSIQTDR